MISTTESTQANTTPKLREAYLELEDEIAAVPEEALATINIDVLASVTTVIGALPELMALRDEFVTHLPTFDIGLLDKFEAYTLALAHAHAQHLGADQPEEDTAALAEAVSSQRELLLSDWRALARRGLVSGAKLQELKGTNGYRNSAGDVLTVAGIIRNRWDDCAGKTALTLAELDEAESLAYRLLSSLGRREQAQAEMAAAVRTRQQAYTLFVRAHDQIRRGLCYLRWNVGDWEDLLPSLYAGRGRKTRSDQAEASEESTPSGEGDTTHPPGPGATGVAESGATAVAGTTTAQLDTPLGKGPAVGVPTGGAATNANATAANAANAANATSSAGTLGAGVTAGNAAAVRSDLPGGNPFASQ